MRRLVIISDTPVRPSPAGAEFFEPTLREIASVLPLFTSVAWVTYLHSGKNWAGSTEGSERIKIVLLPDLRGGKGWRKLFVVFTLPILGVVLLKEIGKGDIIHTRGPSVPALIGILWSFVDSKRRYWHKYAGEWNEQDSPAAYRLQRWLLKRLRKPNVRITVNGAWPGLHNGFVSLENPCLDQALLSRLAHLPARNYSERWKICFVGSLEPFKGAMRLARALQDERIAPRIDELHIIGDGSDAAALRELMSNSRIRIRFDGSRSRDEIFSEVYPHCHFLVLPSKTEGFPKVVAEAAAHRCIPVVTDISALSQYIRPGENGFLIPDPSEEAIRKLFLDKILPHPALAAVADQAFQLSALFTYERFRQRIADEVISGLR